MPSTIQLWTRLQRLGGCMRAGLRECACTLFLLSATLLCTQQPRQPCSPRGPLHSCSGPVSGFGRRTGAVAAGVGAAVGSLRGATDASGCEGIADCQRRWEIRQDAQLPPPHSPPLAPLYAYVLTSDWVPERLQSARDSCTALSASAACAVVPAPDGRHLSDAAVTLFEEQRLVSLAPTPRPAGLFVLPGPLRPLGVEHDSNQMLTSKRARKTIANTVGNIRILQHMAATAALADAQPRNKGEPLPSASMVFLYLEDDAQVVAPDFGARLAQLVGELEAGSWDMMSLVPAPGLCSRARRSPWFPRNGLLAPTLSFSRTTALAYSAEGVQRLLASLPAPNTVDLWYRQLMRQRRLRVRIFCGLDALVTFGNASSRQV